jgi:hypothetical protein
MKVLWICNIVLPVIAEKLGLEVSHKEGWLAGLSGTILEHRLENQIELHVAYPVGNERLTGELDAQVIPMPEYGEDAVLYGYGFYEDMSQALLKCGLSAWVSPLRLFYYNNIFSSFFQSPSA